MPGTFRVFMDTVRLCVNNVLSKPNGPKPCLRTESEPPPNLATAYANL